MNKLEDWSKLIIFCAFYLEFCASVIQTIKFNTTLITLDAVRGTKSVWINGISEGHLHSSGTLTKKMDGIFGRRKGNQKVPNCNLTPEKIGIPLGFGWKIVIFGQYSIRATLDNLLQHNANTNANNNIMTNYKLSNYKRNRGMEQTKIPIWGTEKCLWNLLYLDITLKNIFKFQKGKML